VSSGLPPFNDLNPIPVDQTVLTHPIQIRILQLSTDELSATLFDYSQFAGDSWITVVRIVAVAFPPSSR